MYKEVKSVWLIIEHEPYENDYIMGVYSTEELANEKVKKYNKQRDKYDTNYYLVERHYVRES